VLLRIRLSGVFIRAGVGDERRVGRQGLIDKLALFEFVDGVRTRRGAGRGRAPDVVGSLASLEHPRQARLDEVPAAVVLRLFLRPDELRGVRVAGEDFAQAAFGKRVELFEPQDGRSSDFKRAAFRS
jgi:hypothetical protein